MILAQHLRKLFAQPPRPWYADPLKAYERGYEAGRQHGRNELRIEELEARKRQVDALGQEEKP